MKIMTYQDAAGFHPCYFGFETMNPLFIRGTRGESAILTVNAGYE